ncbi:MAG TPA: Clp protease N-terminal domain-containing protein, partial [Acidimicrobiales bacterium]|nr:Clp protease N-terminal domain-containing protein [Acidimicrobiales bacterium]
LFDEPDGLAAKVLATLGVVHRDVMAKVGAIVGRGPTPVTGRPPFTPRAAKVLEEAINASQDLGHNYQGTEHILLGLYRGQDGLARQILVEMGATPEKVRDEVVKALAGFQRQR